ncbi:MAG: hypothetical protein AAF518_15100 [Spirochaetota bacterium]
MKQRKSNHTYRLVIFSLFTLIFSQCIESIRYRNVKEDIPKPSVIDKKYCEKDAKLSYLAYVLRSRIGDKTWSDFHRPLLTSHKAEDKEYSLQVLKARAAFARCAELLFAAISTGSARELDTLLSTESALKDIDMSVPAQNLLPANKWLQGYIKDPDKTLEMSLLLDPVEILACRKLSGSALVGCVEKDVYAISQILLRKETELRKVDGGTHAASEEDLHKLCPGNFSKSKNTIFEDRLFQQKTQQDVVNLLKSYAHYSEEEKIRYHAVYLALENPAYYMQSGSIRRWVVEREPEILSGVKKLYSRYLKSKQVRLLQAEGAILEQFIRASRHKNSFYYKFKYLFRAADHAGFMAKERLPELYAIHKIAKKTRPDKLQDLERELEMKRLNGDWKEYPALQKYRNGMTLESLQALISTSEKELLKVLRSFYQKRRQQKINVWNQICPST